ncbi:hypothetical protein [Pontibacter roseus]|uniref:hypothetical protein n=1 Tax=Pontibacter roseus TaxID=336989 RepID=UPI00036AF781|nr:hypothetical protein [Pontibacter roseus]
MTRYLFFFLTGFAHALIILLYFDLSGEDALFYRTVGLAGAVPLFALASWLTLFSMRAGAAVASVCLLVLLYWNVAAAQQTLQWGASLDTILLMIHVVLGALALVAFITSLRYTFRSRLSWLTGTPRPSYVLKVLLAAIPVTVAVAYFLYA